MRKADQAKISLLLTNPKGAFDGFDSGDQKADNKSIFSKFRFMSRKSGGRKRAASDRSHASDMDIMQEMPEHLLPGNLAERTDPSASSISKEVPLPIVQQEMSHQQEMNHQQEIKPMEQEEVAVSQQSSAMQIDEEAQLDDGTEYRIILAVHRVTPDYVRYQIDRAGALFKNKMKPKKLRKSSEQIKKGAAKSALKERPKDQQLKENSDEWKKAVDTLVGGGDGIIGHAWVKFQAIRDGRPMEISSVGFVPKNEMRGNPYQQVPGQVVSPDVYHEPYMGQPGNRTGSISYITRIMPGKWKTSGRSLRRAATMSNRS